MPFLIACCLLASADTRLDQLEESYGAESKAHDLLKRAWSEVGRDFYRDHQTLLESYQKATLDRKQQEALLIGTRMFEAEDKRMASRLRSAEKNLAELETARKEIQDRYEARKKIEKPTENLEQVVAANQKILDAEKKARSLEAGISLALGSFMEKGQIRFLLPLQTPEVSGVEQILQDYHRLTVETLHLRFTVSHLDGTLEPFREKVRERGAVYAKSVTELVEADQSPPDKDAPEQLWIDYRDRLKRLRDEMVDAAKILEATEQVLLAKRVPLDRAKASFKKNADQMKALREKALSALYAHYRAKHPTPDISEVWFRRVAASHRYHLHRRNIDKQFREIQAIAIRHAGVKEHLKEEGVEK